MKILVTGASGYIGNQLAHTLATRGNFVHALVRSDNAVKNLRHPYIQVFKGNILDKKSLRIAMKGCSQVYHTAGLVKLWTSEREDFYTNNVGGTINVLETAVENDIAKLVYTSSGAVWSKGTHHALTENDPRLGSFNNDYELSKHLAEKKVSEYCANGLKGVIVNPTRVYGPGIESHSNGVNRFIQMVLDHKVTALPWKINTVANYVYIDDVVKGHILAMEKGLDGERYILGGQNISYKQLAQSVSSFTRSHHYFIPVPLFALKAWALYHLLKSQLKKSEPYVTSADIQSFTGDKIFDCSKAKKQLGYTTTPFAECIGKTIEFLKQKKYGK